MTENIIQKIRREDRFKPENHPILNAARQFGQLEGPDKRHLLEFVDGRDGAGVVRIELDGAHNLDKALADAVQFKDYLRKMRDEWGIPTLDPQFVVGADAHGSKNLYGFVQKIDNAKPFEDVIDHPKDDDLNKYRELAERLVHVLVEAMERGGYVYPEVMRLDQYLLVEDQPGLPVFVDVTPESHAELMGDGINDVVGYAADHVEDSLRWLTEDIISLEVAAQGDAVVAYEQLKKAVHVAYLHGFLDEDVRERIELAISTSNPFLVSTDDGWWYDRD